MEHLDDRKSLRSKGWIIALIVLGAIVLTSVLTIGLARFYLFPDAFAPVKLSAGEQTALDQKIQTLTSKSPPSKNRTESKKERPAMEGESRSEPLAPEPYQEEDANRKIRLNERELNALLAKNSDLADKVAIDLSKNMASVKILIPLDPDLPVFGGKTLKVTAGLELRHDRQQTEAILKGVSVWGVPIPNAWLGGYKNKDLIKAFHGDNGFWQALSSGIEDLRVEDGHLTLQLAK